MHTIKVTAVGDSIGIVFPPAVLEHLRIADGDELQLSETVNGVELTPFNGEVSRQLKIVEKIMEKRHDLLRKLAE